MCVASLVIAVGVIVLPVSFWCLFDAMSQTRLFRPVQFYIQFSHHRVPCSFINWRMRSLLFSFYGRIIFQLMQATHATHAHSYFNIQLRRAKTYWQRARTHIVPNGHKSTKIYKMSALNGYRKKICSPHKRSALV